MVCSSYTEHMVAECAFFGVKVGRAKQVAGESEELAFNK